MVIHLLVLHNIIWRVI